MTVVQSSAAVPARSVSSAVGALRSRGLRVSSARRLVLEALFAGDGPLTAEQIAAGLDGRLPTSDLASVYRNLETLEEIGLVRHVHLGHGPGLYTLTRGEHEYLACERCDAFVAVGPTELDAVRAVVRQTFGYEASFRHFPLVGLCPDCAQEESRARVG
jgi:Fur family transcriptional regulator, ferric uptake regulator